MHCVRIGMGVVKHKTWIYKKSAFLLLGAQSIKCKKPTMPYALRGKAFTVNSQYSKKTCMFTLTICFRVKQTSFRQQKLNATALT